MFHRTAFVFLVLAGACGSSPKPAPASPAAADSSSTPAGSNAAPAADSASAGGTTAAAAKEGQTCGNGTLGMPNIACEPGLVCDYGAGTAPKAPAGAQGSAVPGHCKKAP
jgi:hypothetical protein